MKIFQVRATGDMDLDGRWVRCVLGRSGVRDAPIKREGDGATPAGLWPIRRLLYRPDVGPAPRTRLEAAPISPDDGWCDEPDDPCYNQFVKFPYPARAERLWRTDRVYDRIVVLGYNDTPVVAGAGSAIFLHLARADFAPTEGCVALAEDHMAHFLALAAPGDAIRIDPPPGEP